MAAHLELRKRIPVAAGLGGGSSDAAGDLDGLELSWPGSSWLDEAGCSVLAAGLGADVPFFLGRGPAVGRGTGTELSPMDLAALSGICCLIPGCPCPPAGSMKTWILADLSKDAAGDRGLGPGASGDLGAATIWATVAMRRLPELAELLERLRQAGALTQAVSGSGPTLFGLFAHPGGGPRRGPGLAPIVSGLAGRGPGPHRPGDRQYLGESRMDDLKIFTGNANRPLAEKICKHLDIPLGEAVVGRFSDGEISVEFRENVRGKDVYVIQPTCMPCNETPDGTAAS